MVAYNSIMQHVKATNMLVKLKILDNEASKEYKIIIKYQWKIKYQLLPSHIHRQNSSKRAIQTFRAHFLSILTGVANDLLRRHWDQLLPQSELNLNLLRKGIVQPDISA